MNDYGNAIAAWDAAYIQIANVRHGLLRHQRAMELEESSAFLYVMGERTWVHIEGTPYCLKSNALFHIERNQPISIDAAQREAEYYLVAYQPSFPQNAGREMTKLLLEYSPFETRFAIRPRNAAYFARQFQELSDAWTGDRMQGRLTIKRAFYAIAEEFFRELAATGAHTAPMDTFQKAKAYIEQNYAQDHSIQMLADTLNIGRTTLFERFKRELGQSPQQYLMELRLEAARQALLAGAMTHNEIAVSCGLRDKDYFSRVFSKRFGMPPGAYRRQYRGAAQPDATVEGVAPGASFQKKARLIESMGRIHRYYDAPERVVCLNYSAAELCAALGVAERIAGVASAEGSLADCDAAHRPIIAAAPFLPGHSEELNVPSFQAVCACNPHMVIGTSYSFHAQGGVADAAAFEDMGIHIYAFKATCVLESTFESTYEDITNLGRIFHRERRAGELIASMREQERLLGKRARPTMNPVRIFSFDDVMGERAFTCGQSLESHMMRAAGGVNVFADRRRLFAAVEWEEVAKANPEAIIVHRFFGGDDGEEKVRLLKKRPELQQTPAIRNNRLCVLGIKKVFPGIDNVRTALALQAWLQQSAALC
jgi:iron complex transport system substrate-binding protein